MKNQVRITNNTAIYAGIVLIVILGFLDIFWNIIIVPLSSKSNASQNSTPIKDENTNDPLYPKFQLLSSQGNSSCSQDFRVSILSMPDDKRLQGSCCSPMVFSKYKEQIIGLKKFADTPEIPSDPYDIPASLAKKLLEYDTSIIPTTDEQKILDKAVADSPEKGYCCCKCWRWYVYEGLSKYLVHEKHFTAQQVTEVLANSDGCGGSGAL